MLTIHGSVLNTVCHLCTFSAQAYAGEPLTTIPGSTSWATMDLVEKNVITKLDALSEIETTVLLGDKIVSAFFEKSSGNHPSEGYGKVYIDADRTFTKSVP